VAPAVVRLGLVDSTQRVAFGLAAQGAPDRTVVVADSQGAGRGRRGRVWQDVPGTSLLVSVLVRPALAPARLPTLSLATAVAVARTLRRVAHVEATLKWPNDVRVGERKIAGILLESRLGGAPLVVVGIGINVLQQRFPPPLDRQATSLLLATQRRVPRETLLEALLEEFDAWRTRLEGEGAAAVRAEWLRLADTIGRVVTVGGHQGVAIDLDPDGALLVRDGARIHRIVADELEAPAGDRE
jgi:BirA family biotin operon repressor/biotin-[acetyl-CoA-carboxylase] ligase